MSFYEEIVQQLLDIAEKFNPALVPTADSEQHIDRINAMAHEIEDQHIPAVLSLSSEFTNIEFAMRNALSQHEEYEKTYAQWRSQCEQLSTYAPINSKFSVLQELNVTLPKLKEILESIKSAQGQVQEIMKNTAMSFGGST